MRKPCIWVYRFHLYDGENVFTYCLRAENVKCAISIMQKVNDRDFPEFGIISCERVCSFSKFTGKLDFPVYVDNLDDIIWKDVFYKINREEY